MITTRPTSWTRKLLFLAIAWGVALVILLAVAEVVLRVTDDGWGRTLRLNVVRNRTYEFAVSDLYPSDRATIRYSRDEYGLRGECSPPGAIDILTVGGSTTDQRYLALDATWQSVLQEDLARQTGVDACVANAGLDGQSTYGHLWAFRDWFPLIDDLKPKIVVFFVGINDADFTLKGPNHYDNGEAFDLKSKLKNLRVVQLGFWVGDVFGAIYRRDPAYSGHRKTAKDEALYPAVALAPDTPARAARNAAAFRSRLRLLLDDARAMGAEPLCVSQPEIFARAFADGPRGVDDLFGPDAAHSYNGLDFEYSLRQLDAVIREECGEGHYLDMHSDAFAPEDFYDYVHATPSGARKQGELMAGYIAQTGLIERLRR